MLQNPALIAIMTQANLRPFLFLAKYFKYFTKEALIDHLAAVRGFAPHGAKVEREGAVQG
jgi:hypothetical protein